MPSTPAFNELAFDDSGPSQLSVRTGSGQNIFETSRTMMKCFVPQEEALSIPKKKSDGKKLRFVVRPQKNEVKEIEKDRFKTANFLLIVVENQDGGEGYFGSVSNETLLVFSSLEKVREYIRKRQAEKGSIPKKIVAADSPARIVVSLRAVLMETILSGECGYWNNLIIDPLVSNEIIPLRESGIVLANFRAKKKQPPAAPKLAKEPEIHWVG